MRQKISTQLPAKAVNRRLWVHPLIAMLLWVAIFFFLGCAGPTGTVIKTTDDADETIYQVTQPSALELARWALAQTLPNQKIHRLINPRVGFFVHEHEQKGHYKVARFRDATFIYEVDLLRMRGLTNQGQSVVGYTYAIKGVGDLKSGPDKLARLAQQLKDGFEKTGKAVTVSSLQPEKPAPPALSPVTSPAPDAVSTGAADEKPSVKETPAAVVPGTMVKEQPLVEQEGAAIAPMPTTQKRSNIEEDDDVFVMLKKLKELLDQGIITEEEFQAKKKELLDRI